MTGRPARGQGVLCIPEISLDFVYRSVPSSVLCDGEAGGGSPDHTDSGDILGSDHLHLRHLRSWRCAGQSRPQSRSGSRPPRGVWFPASPSEGGVGNGCNWSPACPGKAQLWLLLRRQTSCSGRLQSPRSLESLPARLLRSPRAICRYRDAFRGDRQLSEWMVGLPRNTHLADVDQGFRGFGGGQPKTTRHVVLRQAAGLSGRRQRPSLGGGSLGRSMWPDRFREGAGAPAGGIRWWRMPGGEGGPVAESVVPPRRERSANRRARSLEEARHQQRAP